jgi:N-acetylmuramic acid 6-phosphate (MurNAc-6-P) etherase
MRTEKEIVLIEQAVTAIAEALFEKKKIFFYGCGPSGRLAKQMESNFWRPFWKRVRDNKKIWSKLESHFAEPIEDQLIGEMTGGDQAYINPLDGLEDIQLIGRLQLKDRKIEKGDVVICLTEGGESPAVIGAIWGALELWKNEQGYDPQKAKKRLYFIYANPDDKLYPLERSRKVLEEEGITKINLFTGPQAITGATGMQAATIETIITGNILQTALDRTLRSFLSKKEMAKLGFQNPLSLDSGLEEFAAILKEIKRNSEAIMKFVDLESKTYETGLFSTYVAQKGINTVLIDSATRNTTFRLLPLDTLSLEKRKSWIQIWTPSSNQEEAWKSILGRKFKGLSSKFYRQAFEEDITDPYFKEIALAGLEKAGDEQQALYDFSFSEFNTKKRGPAQGDLGVLIVIGPEGDMLQDENSAFRAFIDLFKKRDAHLALILVSDKAPKKIMKQVGKISGFKPEEEDSLIILETSNKNNPLGLNENIALKVLLNAQSTAVMARLGKVVGNTMINVTPNNLKLIGRATHLIQYRVNDILSRPQWVSHHGLMKEITYGEANAVLFQSKKFLRSRKNEISSIGEVSLSIVRILESLRLTRGVSLYEALTIVRNTGLINYLSEILLN